MLRWTHTRSAAGPGVHSCMEGGRSSRRAVANTSFHGSASAALLYSYTVMLVVNMSGNCCISGAGYVSFYPFQSKPPFNIGLIELLIMYSFLGSSSVRKECLRGPMGVSVTTTSPLDCSRSV